jgi:hypothetical protein
VGPRSVPLLPVVVTGLAAFATSIVWYSPLLFGELVASLDPTPPPAGWVMLVAPLREIAAAYVVAWLLVALRLSEGRRAAGLGAGLWLGFHAVMMAGAVAFSGMPWLVGLVHAGDWLMKLLLMSVVLARWLARLGRMG